MSIFQLPYLPLSVYMAAAVSFGVAVLLVLTKGMHGRFSMDGLDGVQKMHAHPTPCIVVVDIVLGQVVAWAKAPLDAQALEFGKHRDTIGFDNKQSRIHELQSAWALV